MHLFLCPFDMDVCGKTLINKICKIHHRTLRMVYSECNKSYGEFVQLSNNMSIHQRHLQYLAFEVFKSLMHLNPEFMWSYFNENPIPYDLREGFKVFLPPVKSFRLGLNSIHFRGSILWNNLPSSIENSQTVNEFKVKVKNFGNIHCTCSVCRCDVFIFCNLLRFLTFLLCTFPKYLFIYSKVLIA